MSEHLTHLLSCTYHIIPSYKIHSFCHLFLTSSSHLSTTNLPTNYHYFYYTLPAVNTSTSSLRNSNAFNGTLLPCPTQTHTTPHPACSPFDLSTGHYYGQLTPSLSGPILIAVYYQKRLFNLSTEDGFFTPAEIAATQFQWVEIAGSPFVANIRPDAPLAENSDVYGERTCCTYIRKSHIFICIFKVVGKSKFNS